MQLTPSTQTHHVEVLHGKIAQAANVGEDHVGNDDTRVVVHVLLNIFEEVFAHLLAPDVEDSAEVVYTCPCCEMLVLNNTQYNIGY